MKRLLVLSVLLLSAVSSTIAGTPPFEIGQKSLLKDGEPFVVRSGEMHYSRIPKEYWGHRLRMARSLGLNTVSTYVFWNAHEREPGKFDFSADLDVAVFCRMAQVEGLNVIIRPGPYVCAEWDFGGLPWWLLKEGSLNVRSSDPRYLEASRRYILEVGKQLAPLQVTKGGPIIMVQVENEYDPVGGDKAYFNAVCGFLREAGFEVPFSTSEMSWMMRGPAGQALIRGVGFGYDPEKHFGRLQSAEPNAALYCSEFYTGWYGTWGRRGSEGGVPKAFLAALEWMLKKKASFNFYMLNGGTSFGFTAGANDHPFRPHLTSYDYNAPISEAGWPTEKYFAIRELMEKYLPAGEK